MTEKRIKKKILTKFQERFTRGRLKEFEEEIEKLFFFKHLDHIIFLYSFRIFYNPRHTNSHMLDEIIKFKGHMKSF